jgi:Carboxypeptidase regulatory-like domain
MARKLGCLMLVLFAVTAGVAADGGAISGYVKDSSGTPQLGAVVQIFTSAASLGAVVFTDQNGFYAADHLLPGLYQVKVTAPAFMPSMRENLSLREGTRLLVNITLNTLTDAAKVLPARRSSSTEPDDWHWTLRSAANRPILRAVGGSNSNNGQDSSSLSNPALTEQAQDRSSTTRLAFIAGSEAEGFGSSGDVTTAFAFEKSMFAGGTLSFNGDIGSSTSGDPAGVLRASYAHDFGDLSRPVITLTYRRFATPGAAGENSPYAAMEINTSDHMALSEAIELEYGGALESVEFAKRVNAFRPYGAVLVHLSPDWVVEYRYATAEPDTRAAKGFDSAPADLSESGPKMAVTNGMPDVERAQHQEISASRRFGKTSVQVACYTDHVHNLVLTGAGDPSNSDDVLPDLYSGTFSYAYGSDFNTTGARVVVERKILDQLTATLDYSTGGAITADSAINWQNLAQALATVRQQSVGAKISGYFHSTGTRWIASYKWTSGNVISPVDAFNASPGQSDPFLSVFIRQRLPGTSFIPAKMDALVDLRNMLAQGYVPIVGPDGRIVYLMQSARSLRAGLAFTF